MKEVLYTPDSRIREPGRLIREFFEGLFGSRDLGWQLFLRDFKAKYRQSLLGFAWAVIPALAAGIGLTLAKNAQIFNVGETPIPYAAYVMLSMTIWQTFRASVDLPLNALAVARPMLSKIFVPPEALFLAKLGEVLVDVGVRLIFVLGLFLWFGIPFSWGLLLAAPALVCLILFGVGIGLVLAPFSLLYQDVQRSVVFFMNILLFLTPVIYPIPTEGKFALLISLNPVTPLLTTTRELATGMPVTDPISFLVAAGVGMVIFFVAALFFRLVQPILVERFSA